MESIDRMTMWEYELRMKAHSLRIVDREYQTHLQAWVNRAANAKKKKGKDGLEYVFKKFEKFFDYKKRVKEIEKGKEKGPAAISDVAKSYMKYRRKEGKDEWI